MTLIRKIAFTIACSGLAIAAPMANARTTSGSVPAFTVSTVGQNNGNDEGGGARGRGIKWPVWVAGLVAIVTGGIIIGSGSR
ncbi:MAG: hypothetical protein ACKOUT_05840 [Novosphingobium sp.]